MKKLLLAVSLLALFSGYASAQRSGPPVCTLQADALSPVVGAIATITASCTNSPTKFNWSNCPGANLFICSATSNSTGNKTYSLTATNSSGNSQPVSVTLNWRAATTPPAGTFGPPVVNSLPLQWVDSRGRVVGRATGPENRQVLINFSATSSSPASLAVLEMGYGKSISWKESYLIWIGSGCNTGKILGLGAGGQYVMNSNPYVVLGVVKEGSTFNLYSVLESDVTVAPYGNGEVYSYWDSYLQGCYDTNYIGYYPIKTAPFNLSTYFTPPFKLQ